MYGNQRVLLNEPLVSYHQSLLNEPEPDIHALPTPVAYYDSQNFEPQVQLQYGNFDASLPTRVRYHMPVIPTRISMLQVGISHDIDNLSHVNNTLQTNN